MSKRKEIDPEFRIWLTEECLTGRMGGREAARRTGVPFAAGVDLTEAVVFGHLVAGTIRRFWKAQ